MSKKDTNSKKDRPINMHPVHELLKKEESPKRKRVEGEPLTLEDYVDMISEIKELEKTRGYLLPPDK